MSLFMHVKGIFPYCRMRHGVFDRLQAPLVHCVLPGSGLHKRPSVTPARTAAVHITDEFVIELTTVFWLLNPYNWLTSSLIALWHG